METVRSRLEFSTPFALPFFDTPKAKPLFSDTCLVLGVVDMPMFQGVLPFLVFMITTPEDISPYSTDGTPLMTSTDSMFEEAMLLVVLPDTLPVRPFREELVKDALLESLTPSTSMAVPKATLPFSDFSPLR